MLVPVALEVLDPVAVLELAGLVEALAEAVVLDDPV
jgi:hypothetical protein